MSLYLQIVLISASIIFFLYIVRQIRKSKVKIDFTFFWIIFGIILLILSIFPWLADLGARMTGIISPVTFVLVLIIFLLMYKVFSLSLQISKWQEKFERLVQELALKKKEEEENEVENK